MILNLFIQFGLFITVPEQAPQLKQEATEELDNLLGDLDDLLDGTGK